MKYRALPWEIFRQAKTRPIYFCLMADAYTTADVDYRWKGGDDQGIEIVSAEMAQFDLTGVKTRTKSQTNSKGDKVEQ